MPLDTRMVGQRTRRFDQHVDARWLMAYAAGLGDCNPRYMDTSAGRVAGHPLFPVCLEWPVILSSRELDGSENVTPEESARGVHAAHDLHIFKPILADENYHTEAVIVGMEAIRPGAAQTTRLDTFNAAGELVSQTWQLGISRGVAVTGEATWVESPPPLPDFSDAEIEGKSRSIPVQEGFANIYTETAKIFNPIHSDKAFALNAGLPDIILHGTATLALAVSEIVSAYLQDNPARVKRIGGRFSAMVLMPTTLELKVLARQQDGVSFEVNNPDGTTVFSQGYLMFE